MSRPPVFPPEQKTRIVLSILAGEIYAADAPWRLVKQTPTTRRCRRRRSR